VHFLKNNMSNKILTFCSVATCFATLSLLNISSATAGGLDNISGNGAAGVGSTARGVTRSFSAESKGEATSPTLSLSNSNSFLNLDSSRVATEANSDASAGAYLQGLGKGNAEIKGAGVPGGAQINVSASAGAQVVNAATGNTGALSTSGLNSGTGFGTASALFTFSGMR
jgi:hypothetical protein